MLLKSLIFSVKNLRGITRIISSENSLDISLQRYSRWAPRQHAAIVNEDELFDVNVKTTTPPLPKVEKRHKPRLLKTKTNKTEKEEVETQDEVGKDKGSSLIYTKLYENEKLLSSIMMNLQSKKQRKKNDLILLEGVRFIKDAIEAGLVPETIIFSNWEDIKQLTVSDKVTKLYKVPYRSIQLWSTLTTSPGIMGIFKKPQINKSAEPLPITVICDNVRDPGNMGSILRAAAGVGCEKVILTKGCVDFWDTKVVRSAAGAHFRIPIYGSQEWDEIRMMINNNANVYVADNNADDCDKNNFDEDEIMEKISSEKEIVDVKSKNNNRRKRNNSLEKVYDLPVVPYYAVDYTKNEVILIVGGETEGLSMESFELIKDKKGVRVNIPLNNSIDSLNAGMALGVVAFEVKRQFLTYKKILAN